ncbi:hypothetical protein SKAU_G00003200 [Synaphobranchus kaupii]|uniref:Uncharacterized protein n=1 Tax=Synaphobranchus kaupii TaxID=118154 RepID=A0A9Q1JCL7_SYNKA|nr:hypothetical protein SKAU_G00003200 [Synaphobranchus kaupii]
MLKTPERRQHTCADPEACGSSVSLRISLCSFALRAPRNSDRHPRGSERGTRAVPSLLSSSKRYGSRRRPPSSERETLRGAAKEQRAKRHVKTAAFPVALLYSPCPWRCSASAPFCLFVHLVTYCY